jgi:hypothetical protein
VKKNRPKTMTESLKKKGGPRERSHHRGDGEACQEADKAKKDMAQEKRLHPPPHHLILRKTT